MMKLKLKTLNVIALFASLMAVSSCVHTTPSGSVTATVEVVQQEQSPEDYMQMATVAESPIKERYLLEAAEQFLSLNQLIEAYDAIQNIETNQLDESQIVHYKFLKARIALAHHQFMEALAILGSMPEGLPNDLRRVYLELMAQANYQTGEIINSINNRMVLDDLITDSEQHYRNQTKIWQALQSLPPNNLLQLYYSLGEGKLKAWVELAVIVDPDVPNPEQGPQDIHTWSLDHPRHPATQFVQQIQSQERILTNYKPPKHIALLLPIHGPLAKSANAIQQGFFSAYYQSKKHNPLAPHVNIIDTSRGSVQAYLQALSQGADFIVGPLSKQNVELVAKQKINIPVLALNFTEDTFTTQPMFQFSLSTIDEAEQVAERAWRNGHTHALIIVPDSRWGRENQNYFTQRWEQLGGTVTDSLRFSSKTNMNTAIRNLLKVTDSNNRARRMKRILRRKKIGFVPSRRKDFNVIFVTGTPKQVKQIVPLLKFYYAGDVPMYATSAIYQSQAKSNRDLNGVIFNDMPFILSHTKAQKQVQKNVIKHWPNIYSHYPRLFVFGMDAYKLATHLDQLNELAQLGLKGHTGQLHLSSDHRIHRHLNWAVIKNGKPKPLL